MVTDSILKLNPTTRQHLLNMAYKAAGKDYAGKAIETVYIGGILSGLYLANVIDSADQLVLSKYYGDIIAGEVEVNA